MDGENSKRQNPESVEDRLRQFAVVCNKDSPHPRDWRRFYLFAVYAHQRRIQWDEFALRTRLRRLGFNERYASDFSIAYWHVRCALYLTKPRPLNESHHGWIGVDGIPST